MQNSPFPLWMVVIGLLREAVGSELPLRAEGDEAAERGRCGAGRERGTAGRGRGRKGSAGREQGVGRCGKREAVRVGRALGSPAARYRSPASWPPGGARTPRAGARQYDD